MNNGVMYAKSATVEEAWGAPWEPLKPPPPVDEFDFDDDRLDDDQVREFLSSLDRRGALERVLPARFRRRETFAVPGPAALVRGFALNPDDVVGLMLLALALVMLLF